ncbi:MAG: bifunctional 4-hydroxy-2-oxoglutarate aldolase/2-dehydro-3-deoxy-phosphogluconate aldolase [Verrucomicrobiae bacterium]|nr:bifunctional 4-hydroxy-2-oxoglutarate aldolase/2-dehydro-3-deoxy-phosphogluconate aldolase [Verrucomicrobiae bacterium]
MKPHFLDSDLGQHIQRQKLIAVLVIDRAEDAVPVAESLLAGGVDIMELTLRTEAAIDALLAIREKVPEMTAGVGTILTKKQADLAYSAGAAFGVAPAVNREVALHAMDMGLPFAPGVMTPTDIDQSVELGCRLLKFFPAESSGGLPHLKNIAAPYAHLGLKFIPLGGINLDNLLDYLWSDLIAAVGGSWLAPRDLIAAGDWSQIEANAREARAKVNTL